MEQYKKLWQQHKGALDSLAWPSWEGGTRIKNLQINNKNLRLQEISSEFIDPTWCDRGHVGFVIQGELEVDFQQDAKKRFPEGGGLIIQKGLKHKARSVTPKVLLFLVEDLAE